MTYEEYKQKRQTIEAERDKKLNDLVKSYVEANAKFKIGDIISDFTHAIKIEKIKASLFRKDDCPDIIYIGIQLTKKLEPHKRGERLSIYQNRGHLIKP